MQLRSQTKIQVYRECTGRVFFQIESVIEINNRPELNHRKMKHLQNLNSRVIIFSARLNIRLRNILNKM